jgi:large subunit ribosomal protein L10
MVTKKQKKQIIEDLSKKFKEQKSTIFFNYSGLKVDQFQDLRNQLREKGMECKVAKKTLADLALKEAGYEHVKTEELEGQVAIVLGYEDEILPAKTIYEFSKQNESLNILAGLVESQYLDSDSVIALAKLPSRDELIAKLVGQMKAPLSGLVNSLDGNLRKLVFALKAISEAKQ